MNEEKKSERELLIKQIKRLTREGRNAQQADKYDRALKKAEQGIRLLGVTMSNFREEKRDRGQQLEIGFY